MGFCIELLKEANNKMALKPGPYSYPWGGVGGDLRPAAGARGGVGVGGWFTPPRGKDSPPFI